MTRKLRRPFADSLISSGYGERTLVTDSGAKIKHGHWAIDYAVGEGTPLAAVHDGVIAAHQWDAARGYMIAVDHADGSDDGHRWHMVKRAGRMSVGSRVKAGDVIAYVAGAGERGSSSNGNHGHLEHRTEGELLRIKGEKRFAPNPLVSFEAADVAQGENTIPITDQSTAAGLRGLTITEDADMALLLINNTSKVIYWVGALTWERTRSDVECNALGRSSGQISPSVFKRDKETLDAAIRRVLTAGGYLLSASELDLTRKRVDANRVGLGLKPISKEQY